VAGVPRLFVGQVPLSKHEQDLLPLFSKYGPVDKITLVRGSDSKSRGCCMVQFKKWADAEAAMENLNGVCPFEDQALKARPLFVQFANPRRTNGHMNGELAIAAKKLFVGQVHMDATEDQLKDLFSKFGVVEKIALSPKSNRADSSYTFAFVRFKKWAACEAAIEALHEKYTMNGMDHPLVVKFADAKKENSSSQQYQYQYQQAYQQQYSAGMKGQITFVSPQKTREEQGVISPARTPPSIPSDGDVQPTKTMPVINGLRRDQRGTGNMSMHAGMNFRPMEHGYGELSFPHPYHSHPFPHHLSTYGGLATPAGKVAQGLQHGWKNSTTAKQGANPFISSKEANQNGRGTRGLVAAYEAGSSSDSLADKAESDGSEGLYSLGQLSSNSLSPMVVPLPPAGLLGDPPTTGMHAYPHPSNVPPHGYYPPPSDARMVGFQPYMLPNMLPSIPANPFFPRPPSQKLGLGVKDPLVYTHKLFIGQVPVEANEYDLWNIFAPYGEILELVVLRSAGVSKGCAFLTFSTKHQALHAIQMLNGWQVAPAKRLVVKFADHKTRSADAASAANAEEEGGVLETKPADATPSS
jgi:RNA recognition motif-containing protein